MQHPDEGTIHGWLDGALSPEEAVRVEHHVDQCASCADAVAEARGLIAATSRILSALDIVPGAVIPERSPPALARTQAPRRWWRSPSLAAAAALILVVGVSVTVLQAPRSEIASALEERATGITEQRRSALETASDARAAEGEQVSASSVPDVGRAADDVPVAGPAEMTAFSPPPSAAPLPATPAPEAARTLPSAPATEPIRLRGRSALGVTDKAVPPRLPVSSDTVRRQIAELAVVQQERISPHADSLASRVVAANVERPRAERLDDPPDPLTRDVLALPHVRRAAASEGQADAASTGGRGAPAAPGAQQRAAGGGERDTARVQLLVISENVDTTLVGVMRTVVYEVRPGIRVTYQTIERRFRTGAQRRDAAAEAASADDAPGERTLLRMDMGRVQAIHWTDAAGLYHSLSGPVEQDELQRIRAALHARADSR